MIQLPGIAWTRVGDGDWPNESPQHWEMLRAYSHRRRYGSSGYALIITVCEPTREPLEDLRDYLDSVAGADWAALPDQYGDPDSYRSVRTEAQACTTACERITAALGDDWSPR